jgi:hypothetical protein
MFILSAVKHNIFFLQPRKLRALPYLGMEYVFDADFGQAARSFIVQQSLNQTLTQSGPIVGLLLEIIKKKMKQFFKPVCQFLKKEWFLLITLVAIAVIVMLFEIIGG